MSRNVAAWFVQTASALSFARGLFGLEPQAQIATEAFEELWRLFFSAAGPDKEVAP